VLVQYDFDVDSVRVCGVQEIVEGLIVVERSEEAGVEGGKEYFLRGLVY